MDQHSNGSFTHVDEEEAPYEIHPSQSLGELQQTRLVIAIDYGTTFTGTFGKTLEIMHGSQIVQALHTPHLRVHNAHSVKSML